MDTIDICKELSQNFIDFSYEANSERAFPDARDGLKPGQRACIWEFYDKGYTSNKPHVKSAKVSGGVIANWWPHGDVAVYETFARMSQPWINNIPEIDWHGANGNQIIGSAPANQRYTEARLSKATEEGLLKGLKKNNIPMVTNFSEDAEWPIVLPAIFPRLMVNGSQGIGVTIANVWLPFALQDVSNSIIKFIDTGIIDYSNLYPDFPSGGIIINKNDIHLIHETGKGKVILRGTAEIKKNSILISELPYQVYVEPFIDSIKKLIEDGQIIAIKDIYNKSDKKKLLIEIECDENPEKVLQQLYKLTDLQKNYNANQWALVGKTPKLLTFKNYVEIYIAHNEDCIVRETNFDLTKAKERKEVIDGLLKALEDIDNIIKLIKKSKSSNEAKEQLISLYKFTEPQAKAIVNMRLGSLANLEKIELQEENNELVNKIDELQNILKSREIRLNIIKENLQNFTKKYATKRKTQITQITIKPEEKEIETVVPEDVVVVLSQSGDIKRIPVKSFKVQKKNGKGVKSEDDAILETISTNTIDTLMFFTNKGKMYRTVVDNVPAGTNAGKGTKISTIIAAEPDEKVIAMTSLYRQTNAKYVVFFTKKGLIKKTTIDEYTKVKRNNGIQAIKLTDNDSIANVTFLDKEDVIVITKKGMSIHFATDTIGAIGRVAAGVKTIKLAEDDEVIVGLPIHKNNDYLTIITENGFGKKTSLDEYPLQARGGKGVMCYRPNETTGNLAGAAMVDEDDNILIIGKPNSICISTKDIPLLTRLSVGNIMIKSKVMKIVKL